MLYYSEFGLSEYEVPGEYSICIYISGCINNCINCHYPELKNPNFGIILKKYYHEIIDLYYNTATCVCFLGEGKAEPQDFQELCECAEYSKKHGLKNCLYSGRDTTIEKWMYCFDYVKIGSYNEKMGDLRSASTNQKMFKKVDGTFIDITYMFRS